MALLFKPHTVTVKRISETKSPTTLVVQGPSLGSGVSVDGQLTPARGDKVHYDSQTPYLALISPHEFLCDATDAAKFHYGDEVTRGARTFVVKAKPATFDSGGVVVATDNCIVLLEELELS